MQEGGEAEVHRVHHYIGTGNPTFPFFRVYPIFSIFRVVDKGVGDREEGVMWFCLFFKGGGGMFLGRSKSCVLRTIFIF